LNQPTPAIVAHGAARPLPRIALWLLCLAYVLPGFIGREPWKNADIASFGYMSMLAGTTPGAGAASWLDPLLLGQAPEFEALLPYWIGAWAIQLAGGWIAPDLAVRLAFAVLLTVALWACWSGIYHLARSAGAQPVAFAFGGEAQPVDYARAVADGGLLALIACLGLAQLSHETTPALTQLLFASLLFAGLASFSSGRPQPLLLAALGLGGLSLSGAPALAQMLGLGGTLVLALATTDGRPAWQRDRPRLIALLALVLAAGLLAWGLDQWRWRISLLPFEWRSWRNLGRLYLWFTWPAWPLVIWTLWRWRRQLQTPQRYLHLTLPLMLAALATSVTLVTPPADRSLLLALPALAALAAFALPTLRRSFGALIDWFTLLFFSGWVITIWVVWLSLQTGIPAKPAANVARLIPGFLPSFSMTAFVLALAATLAWLWLVAWRVGRHRPAIWKSMVLPAGGTTLCWLLLTTLTLPGFDYARSYAPMIRKVTQLTGPVNCLRVESLSRAQLAALQFHGNYVLRSGSSADDCDWLVIDVDAVPTWIAMRNLEGWTPQGTIRRPGDRSEAFALYRRQP